jgi:hypothetical protein
MLIERSDRQTEPARNDVVRVLAHDHRVFHDLGAELFEECLRFYVADELVCVGRSGDFTHHANRFGEAIATELPANRELGAGEFDRLVDDPLIERGLREKDAVRHTYDAIISLVPFARAYDQIAQLATLPEEAARVAAMRREFEARTGAFGPDDPWFEARGAAFMDDAMATQGFARDAMNRAGIDDDTRMWAEAIARSHRGLFIVDHESRDLVLVDLWSGAHFIIDDVGGSDRGLGDALSSAQSPFDARIAARDDPASLAILPGAIFHPEEARDAIDQVLKAARSKSMKTGDILDALLKMERSWRSLVRVKASYAYRLP